jgi:hypothetical protein
MKIRILKTTVADGRFVKAGSVEDVSEADGKLLIGIGKAVPADEPVAATVVEPEPVLTVEDAAPVVAEKRRGRPAKGK